MQDRPALHPEVRGDRPVLGIQHPHPPGQAGGVHVQQFVQQVRRPAEAEHVEHAGGGVLGALPRDQFRQHAAVAAGGVEPQRAVLPVELPAHAGDLLHLPTAGGAAGLIVGVVAVGDVHERRRVRPLREPPERGVRQEVVEPPDPQPAGVQKGRGVDQQVRRGEQALEVVEPPADRPAGPAAVGLERGRNLRVRRGRRGRAGRRARRRGACLPTRRTRGTGTAWGRPWRRRRRPRRRARRGSSSPGGFTAMRPAGVGFDMNGAGGGGSGRRNLRHAAGRRRGISARAAVSPRPASPGRYAGGTTGRPATYLAPSARYRPATRNRHRRPRSASADRKTLANAHFGSSVKAV